MKRLLIQNGHLIDPANGIDQPMDLLVVDGKIAKVGQALTAEGAAILDVSGLTIIPGLVDMHVHLRDPGFTHKEDILSGCEAAAAGGVTSLLCMPNTNPAVDSAQTVAYILNKAKQAKARVYVTGAITKDLDGQELCDFEMLKQAGIVAISDDGKPVKNAAMMTTALREAQRLGLVLTSHCEDLDIIDGGILNDGAISKQFGLKGMHRSSEDSITAREIVLAETNHTAVHIAHVSTKLSVQLIREAKARGVAVTAETCPHYFSLTEQELLKKDADYRMNPPLREEEDRQAIEAGICDGTIDCIVTDHAPHTPEEKADFLQAPNGVIGMETSLAAGITALVKPGKLTLSQLIEKMTVNPATILGISAGSLHEGAPADFALLDPNQEWAVSTEQSHSKASNLVYKGRTLTGKVISTFLGGTPVYDTK